MKVEVNKIYAFALEGKNQKGEELGLIAVNDLNIKGVASVYEKSKELYKKMTLRKCFIFGINDKANIYVRRPDQINFEDTKMQFAKTTLEIDEVTPYLIDRIKDIDNLYNIGLVWLYKDVSIKNIKEYRATLK